LAVDAVEAEEGEGEEEVGTVDGDEEDKVEAGLALGAEGSFQPFWVS
jgi:hypothetical protein